MVWNEKKSKKECPFGLDDYTYFYFDVIKQRERESKIVPVPWHIEKEKNDRQNIQFYPQTQTWTELSKHGNNLWNKLSSK